MPKKIKANHALISALKAWDIDHVYGIPGDSIDAVVDGLKVVEDEIDFYHVGHEEVASLAASSFTKLTGKIGVALSIGGPGAIHLINGMYDAKLDNIPQLILAGQSDSDVLGTKAFQETNLTELFKDVAVYNKQIKEPETIFETVNEAIRTAYAKKGVAVLVLPNDLLTQKIDDHTDKKIDKEPPAPKKPSVESIQDAAKLIENSKKPVMLIGLGTKHAKKELRIFIEKAKIPSIITLTWYLLSLQMK